VATPLPLKDPPHLPPLEPNHSKEICADHAPWAGATSTQATHTFCNFLSIFFFLSFSITVWRLGESTGGPAFDDIEMSTPQSPLSSILRDESVRVEGHSFTLSLPSLFCLFVCLFVCFLFLFFQDRVSLCSPGCPRTHFVDQAGLELRNPPASASQVLGLKACDTTARRLHSLFSYASC
jgi:hypothetical protein